MTTVDKTTVGVIASAVAAAPLGHVPGKFDEIKALPIHAQEQHHVEGSATANAVTAAVVANVPEGPNFRVEPKPAQLEITGQAPNLILSG